MKQEQIFKYLFYDRDWKIGRARMHSIMWDGKEKKEIEELTTMVEKKTPTVLKGKK
jgi:hypothetical protein